MSTTITGTIEAIGRRQNTVDGNPRWTIDLGGKSYNTKDNTMCAHKVDPVGQGARGHTRARRAQADHRLRTDRQVSGDWDRDRCELDPSRCDWKPIPGIQFALAYMRETCSDRTD